MKRERSKIFIFVLLIILLPGLIFSAVTISAQSISPHMEVTPAYDGYFKYGEWLPVWVELENQGNDLNTDLRVEITGSQGTIVYAVPVSLPSGSRKRVPIYVLPNNFSRELKVNLVSDGKLIQTDTASIRPQANISYFVGLLSPERGALSLINGIRLPGQERPKIIVDLSLEIIPDRSEALNSFDLIVINNTDTSKLTTEQASAIAEWVQQGGRLIIGGGTGAKISLAGLPAILHPLSITRSAEIQLDDIAPLATFAEAAPFQIPGPFVVALGEAGSNVNVIAGQNELPLIYQKEVGSGLVDFIALDLVGIPFDGWQGSQAFWETMIGPGGSYPQNMPFDVSPRQYRANALFYALSNIPSLDLPSIQWITILLGIYILIIGPLNYLILRWKRKLHLAWVTIPILTALFTAGSFGIGYTLRGNDLMLNKIALVQLGPSNDARVTAYMGLFSPRQQDYEISVEGNGLISPMSGYDANPWGSGIASATGGEMVFVQGNPATLKGLTVNQWAMQSFMSEGTWQDFGQLTGDLILENDVLKGTVRNETNYTLTDVILVMQTRFARLGDMEPGSVKEVNLGFANLQSDRFGPPLSYRLFEENNTTGGPLPRIIQMKTNIVSSVFENSPWGKSIISSSMPVGLSPISGVSLIGWLDQAPPDIKIAGNNLSYQTTAMVYTSLDFHLPSNGFLSLPPGLIPGAVTKFPDNSGTCGNSSSVSMGRGQAEFDFQIPGDHSNYQVQSLKLAYWQDNSGMGESPELSLMDWENGTWTTIQDQILGINIIKNASGYVDRNGLIRVRLTNNSDMYSCIYIDMGLEAEPVIGEGG